MIRVLLAVAALAVLAAAPGYASPFQVRVLSLFCLWGGMSIAWSILGGFAGYWSFGHTVFVGIGAFVPGLIVAKLDGTARGGVIFSIVKDLDVPLRFVGTGEKADDLAEFDSEEFVDALMRE